MSSFVDVVRPNTKSYLFDSLCILGGSLFLALLSQISFNLWFTPVPITLQTMGVMLIGALLGSKRGVLSVAAYLTEGALGLPVFAGGAFGIAPLFGPTGGYLLGFIPAAFLIGLLLERGWKKSYPLTLVAFSLGTLIIYLVGASALAFFVGIENALVLGIYPFLIGCGIKIFTAAALIPSGWKAVDFFKKDAQNSDPSL